MMAKTSSESAIENRAYETDDQHAAAVVTETRSSGQLFIEKQNEVYVVQLLRDLPKEGKPQLAAEDIAIIGDDPLSFKNDQTINGESRNSATTKNMERPGGTSLSNVTDTECPPAQETAVPANAASKVHSKGTLLHFSNEGFEDDLPRQEGEELAEIQGLVVRGGRRERRRRAMKKLRGICIRLHCRCIGIAFVCLVILALFVVPPTTTW